MRSARQALVGALLVALAIPVGCYDGGFVGAECRDSLTECNGACVDLTSDSNNCGACGAKCPAGRVCHEGLYCEGFDAASGGASGAPGNTECIEPFNSADHCGSCGASCKAPEGLCSCQGEACQCVADCGKLLVQCGTSCADLQTDPLHCGSCFFECPSGLCQDGTCAGVVPGHVVLLCTNLGQVRQYHPATVLFGNAAFLPARGLVRILAYSEFADPATQPRVSQALDWSARAHGRPYQLTLASTSNRIAERLNIRDFEVLLVLDQPSAAPGELENVGAALKGAAEQFVNDGGTVIVLDGADGVAEMGEFITSAGLLSVEGETRQPGTASLYVRAPSDSVSVNVQSPFAPFGQACTFQSKEASDPGTVFVVTDTPPGGALGAPFVVHRVPGF